MGLSNDGSRGIGAFIYRDAIGHGANDFKGVRLRWMLGLSRPEDGTPPGRACEHDPAKAAVQVHALAMVYVPECPFKVGTSLKIGIDRFPDGPNGPSWAAP